MLLQNFPISSTALLLLVLAGVYGYGAIRLHKRAKANPQNDLFHYFGYFFTSFTIFSIIFVLPFLLTPHDTTLTVWGYVIAQAVFTIGVSWLAGFVMRSFNKPALLGQIPILALGVLEIMFHIKSMPVYDVAALATYNISKVSPSKAAGTIVGIEAVLTILPTVYVMIRTAAKVPAARTRSVLIASGLLLTFIGGPMHDQVGPRLFAVADIITILGAVITLIGLLIEPANRMQKR